MLGMNILTVTMVKHYSLEDDILMEIMVFGKY